MCSSFLRSTKTQRVKIQFSVVNDWAGCSNTMNERPHEFFGPSVFSQGWRVQWETVPPGEESEPRSWRRIRGGNEADEADGQRPLWKGERVTGP
jgi:hypothetical protein